MGRAVPRIESGKEKIMTQTEDAFKHQAAEAALKHVADGMKLGLGTGSTAAWFVKLLGARIKDEGLKLRCAATSASTAALAFDVGIAVEELDALGRLDLAVDGADEIGPDLALIKGGGAALLREKIVESEADQFIVIADETKVVDAIGAFALPVEIVRFAHGTTQRVVAEVMADLGLRGTVSLRVRGGEALVTDNGNYILDCACGMITDPGILADALSQIPGVVEHGLFLDMATLAYVAGPGGVRRIERS